MLKPGNDKLFAMIRETFAGINSSIKWQRVPERYSTRK